MAKLTATPSVSLVDDVVHLTATELHPGQAVTIAALLTEHDKAFLSYAHYTADESGKVDLGRAPSVGGTYTDVEPMGLFWSMRPSSEMRRGVRLIKAKVEEPFEYELLILDGHPSVSSRHDLTASGSPLANIMLHRFYQSPDVTAIPIRVRSTRGMLFLPKGSGPFPGVIDIYGAVGGLMNYRAALLASRGFAVLSLAYFGFEDLPKSIELDMEYFEGAIDFLASHKSVSGQGIGVVGNCKGANLAMEMALMSSKVKAVVAINPYFYHDTGTIKRNGIKLNVWNPWYLFTDPTKKKLGMIGENGDVVYKETFKHCMMDHEEDAAIPVERTKAAQYLFVVGEDDMNTDPMNTSFIARRMERFGKTNYQVLSYPGAGHLIEPPYTPICSESYFKLYKLMFRFGGQPKPHSFAQENSWYNILNFLHRNIDSPRSNSRYYSPAVIRAGGAMYTASRTQHLDFAKLGISRFPWSVYKYLRVCSKWTSHRTKAVTIQNSEASFYTKMTSQTQSFQGVSLDHKIISKWNPSWHCNIK